MFVIPVCATVSGTADLLPSRTAPFELTVKQGRGGAEISRCVAHVRALAEDRGEMERFFSLPSMTPLENRECDSQVSPRLLGWRTPDRKNVFLPLFTREHVGFLTLDCSAA